MPNEATQVLAEFAATLKYDDIPEHVREQCKNLLLDTLACAVAGDRGEETGQSRGAGRGAGAVAREPA